MNMRYHTKKLKKMKVNKSNELHQRVKGSIEVTLYFFVPQLNPLLFDVIHLTLFACIIHNLDIHFFQFLCVITQIYLFLTHDLSEMGLDDFIILLL